jgi:exodeoxyribonuclease VII small subunit
MFVGTVRRRAGRLTTPGRACKLAAARELTANCNTFFHVTSKKTTAPDAAPVPDFEASLAELEAIVEKLEHGELSLEDSLRQFERGVQLTRVCQSALTKAEQKVEVLLRRARPTDGVRDDTDEYGAAPFEPSDDNGS